MLYNTAVMEPRIQYAKASDGVNIAFWTLGEGMPLVHMGGLGAGHIELEWQLPECQRWYERLAAGRKLVRYDTRGTGLSDRNVEDLTLEAQVLDLQAVCDRLGLQTFALCGLMHSGPVAIAYAARCPERVSHLILWNTYAQSSEWTQQPTVQSVRALMDKDWTFYTEAMA